MSGLGFKHLKKINQIQPLGDKHKLISIYCIYFILFYFILFYFIL